MPTIRLTLLILAFWLPPADVYSQEKITTIQESLTTAQENVTTVKVAVSQVFPLIWTDKSGKINGLLPQYYKRLLNPDDNQTQPEYISCKRRRCGHLLVNQEVDLLMSAEFESLKLNAIRLGMIRELPIERWQLKSITTKDKKSSPHPRVLVSDEYAYLIEGDNYPTKTFPSSRNFIPMLLAGRADMVVGMRSVLKQLADQLQLSEEDFERELVVKIPVYLWTHQKSSIANDLDYWRERIGAVLSPSQVEKIRTNYFENVLDAEMKAN